MANVGTAAAGKTLIGKGVTTSPTFASIGTDSGLTNHGVVLAQGTGAFVATSPGSAGQVLTSNGASSDPSFQTAVDLHTAKWIVNATPNSGGNQTTISAAITAASSGDTIFIMPGTYTENLTLKAGVNLTAFMGDAFTPTVTIVGKMSFSSAGTVSISNIRLQTNSDNFLAVTGSAASIVNLNSCYLNCTNATGISFTSSSSSARINCNYCMGNLGTTGIGFHSSSSAGSISYVYGTLGNTGNSTTASSNSAGTVFASYSQFNSPLSSSSTGGLAFTDVLIACASINTTGVTHNGTGTGQFYGVYVSGGTASGISIGSGAQLTVDFVTVNSSNTNAITGAGTLVVGSIGFDGSSSTVNTTTQTLGVTYGGEYKGRSSNVAPSATMLGEQIRSAIAQASAITLSNNTGANITSISLTAGIWDVSGVINFNGSVTGTAFLGSISTTSTASGTLGDNCVSSPYPPTGSADLSITIPSYRISLNTTTTVYLTTIALFTVGTLKAYGRISATRVS
jgi:hypothetical protein